jgi:hypothetical protein
MGNYCRQRQSKRYFKQSEAKVKKKHDFRDDEAKIIGEIEPKRTLLKRAVTTGRGALCRLAACVYS